MVMFIASVAVGLILIVALLVYNMQAFTSSPPRRSERQYPLDPSPAEEPVSARGIEAKAEGAGLSHVRQAGDQEPPSAATEAAGNAEAAAVSGTVDAPRAIEAAPSGAIVGAERGEAEEVPSAGAEAVSGEAAPFWTAAESVGVAEVNRASRASEAAGVPAPGSAQNYDGRVSADSEYREAIRRRLQPQQPEKASEPAAQEAAADAPMSDGDYRSALRRFGSRGKRD